MRGGAIPGLVPILSRFCLDPGLSRSKPSNSASQAPLRLHIPSITNVNEDGTIPAVPIPNYKVYNSFRSGDLAPPDGKKTPDMTLKVPELCTLECIDGKLVLWVHVGNEGASPLTSGGTLNVNGVVLGQDTMLGSTDLPLVVDPGKYIDAVEYVLDPKDLESIKIKVDAKELECNLNNNEVTIQGPFCQ